MTQMLPKISPAPGVQALEAITEDARVGESLTEAWEARRAILERARSSIEPAAYFDRVDGDDLDARFHDAIFELGAAIFAACCRALETGEATTERAPAPAEPAPDEPAEVQVAEATPPPKPARPKPTLEDDDEEPFVPARVISRPDDPVDVREEYLAKLQQRLKNSAVDEEQAVHKARIDPIMLGDLKSRVGSQRASFPDRDAVLSERGTLDALTRPQEMDGWRLLPRAVQHSLMSLLTARARTLQAEAHLLEDSVLKDVFQRLSRYSKTYEPGFVHGLALDHQPQHDSWREDTRRWQDAFHRIINKYTPEPETPEDDDLTPGDAQRQVEELLEEAEATEHIQEGLLSLVGQGLKPDTRICRLLVDHLEDLLHPDLKALRKAVKEQQKEDEQEAEASYMEANTRTWHLERLTRGMTAAIVGGDPREDVREKIQHHFGFSELDWIPANKGMRRIQSLSEQARAGKPQIILVLLDFISHSTWDKLRQKDALSIIAPVPNGYGLTQLEMALERAIQRGTGGA